MCTFVLNQCNTRHHRLLFAFTHTSARSCVTFTYSIAFAFTFAGKAVSFIELLVAHSSVLTILVIGYERYYATCRPLEAIVNCTPRRAIKLIAIIWFASLISCIPMLYITELTTAE